MAVQTKTATGKILIYLTIAFVIVSVWTDPRGSFSAISIFLGNVLDFLAMLLDKASQATGR